MTENACVFQWSRSLVVLLARLPVIPSLSQAFPSQSRASQSVSSSRRPVVPSSFAILYNKGIDRHWQPIPLLSYHYDYRYYYRFDW